MPSEKSCLDWKKVVRDLCKQFVNIVVNIFGELKNVLIKIPADIIKYKMGRKLQKGPIIIIKRDYTQTL